MSSSGAASLAATVIIGFLFLGAVVFTYYESSTQNSSLQAEVNGLNQQVAVLQQRTIQVVTMTDTVQEVVTSVSTTSVTTTQTTSVYPVPANVTVFFTKVSGGYSYTVNAGASSYSGSYSTPFSFQVTPVFQGETISVSAAETGAAGCSIGQTVTAQIYMNGSVVAQGTQICTGSNIAISYTV